MIGLVLAKSWEIVTQNLSLLLIMLAVTAPLIIVDNMSGLLSSQQAFVGALFLASIISTALGGTLVHGVIQAVDNKKPDLRESVSRGLAWLMPALAVSFLIRLIVFLGLLALIIPGIALSCVLAVSLEACVAEGLDPIDSLKRSAELTNGYRLKILGLNIIIGFLSLLVSAFVVGLSSYFFPAGLTSLVISILSIPIYAYSVVTYIVLYRFLVNSEAAVKREFFN